MMRTPATAGQGDSPPADDKYDRAMARVTRTNARFEAASVEDRRRMIAQDVLWYLDSGLALPMTSLYGSRAFPRYRGDNPELRRPALLQAYKDEEGTCMACAKGLLLFAIVSRKPYVQLNRIGRFYYGDHNTALQDVFPEVYCDVLEALFEGNANFLPLELRKSNGEVSRPLRARCAYDTVLERLYPDRGQRRLIADETCATLLMTSIIEDPAGDLPPLELITRKFEAKIKDAQESETKDA